jgi:hypothetical protein
LVLSSGNCANNCNWLLRGAEGCKARLSKIGYKVASSEHSEGVPLHPGFLELSMLIFESLFVQRDWLGSEEGGLSSGGDEGDTRWPELSGTGISI